MGIISSLIGPATLFLVLGLLLIMLAVRRYYYAPLDQIRLAYGKPFCLFLSIQSAFLITLVLLTGFLCIGEVSVCIFIYSLCLVINTSKLIKYDFNPNVRFLFQLDDARRISVHFFRAGDDKKRTLLSIKSHLIKITAEALVEINRKSQHEFKEILIESPLLSKMDSGVSRFIEQAIATFPMANVQETTGRYDLIKSFVFRFYRLKEYREAFRYIFKRAECRGILIKFD